MLLHQGEGWNVGNPLRVAPNRLRESFHVSCPVRFGSPTVTLCLGVFVHLTQIGKEFFVLDCVQGALIVEWQPGFWQSSSLLRVETERVFTVASFHDCCHEHLHFVSAVVVISCTPWDLLVCA